MFEDHTFQGKFVREYFRGFKCLQISAWPCHCQYMFSCRRAHFLFTSLSITTQLSNPDAQFAEKYLLSTSPCESVNAHQMPNWTKIKPWPCQCGLTDEQMSYSCLTMQRLQMAWRKCTHTSPESWIEMQTGLGWSSQTLALSIWFGRGVHFLFHNGPQQPIETKSNTWHRIMHQRQKFGFVWHLVVETF